jgi:hypothetical protein
MNKKMNKKINKKINKKMNNKMNSGEMTAPGAGETIPDRPGDIGAEGPLHPRVPHPSVTPGRERR